MADKNKVHTPSIIILTILLLPIFLIGGLVIGIEIGKTNNLHSWILIFLKEPSSWISAIATIIIALLTIVLARETYNLRKIQSNQIEEIRKNSIRPDVSLYIESSRLDINAMNLFIVNNGVGVARDIQFDFEMLSQKTENIHKYFEEKIEHLSLLKNGILSLGSNDKRKSYFFNFNKFQTKDKTNLTDEDIIFKYILEITIYFKDIEGKKYSSQEILNLGEYKGIEGIGRDPFYGMSDSLHRIDNNIHSIINGVNKVRIDTFTTKDKEDELYKNKQNFQQKQR